jgi:hypothetical protein
MFRHACILACLIAFAAPPLSPGGRGEGGEGHAQVTLRWKLEPGDTFRLESLEKHKQKLFTAGKMNESQHTISTVLAVRVQKAAADGAQVELKIESVKVDAPQGDTDGELARLMAGAVFQATITPDGQITTLDGFDAFVKKLAAARGTPERLLRTLITEQGVKKGISEYFGFLPTMAVTKGDAWQREGFIPLGPLGSFQSLNKYTYGGKMDGADIITYESSLTYAAPKNGSDVFKVVKGDLQAKTAAGRYLFDAPRGRLMQAERRLVIVGELAIEVAGNQVEMSFEMDQKTSVRLLAD